MKFQFPHFFRLNSALLLWPALVALIAVNILSLEISRPAYWDKLVMLLWNRGYKQEARNVLGATTDLVDSLARREEVAAELQKKYAFWQTVANSYPDYRDAFIQLATLAYQLGKFYEARSWLARATFLDPNNQTIRGLTRIIPSSLP